MRAPIVSVGRAWAGVGPPCPGDCGPGAGHATPRRGSSRTWGHASSRPGHQVSEVGQRAPAEVVSGLELAWAGLEAAVSKQAPGEGRTYRRREAARRPRCPEVRCCPPESDHSTWAAPPAAGTPGSDPRGPFWSQLTQLMPGHASNFRALTFPFSNL